MTTRQWIPTCAGLGLLLTGIIVAFCVLNLDIGLYMISPAIIVGSWFGIAVEKSRIWLIAFTYLASCVEIHVARAVLRNRRWSLSLTLLGYVLVLCIIHFVLYVLTLPPN